MKIPLIAAGLLVASTLAQAGHGPGGGREEHRAHMRQALGLSSEQIEQMEEIREQGGSREDMHEILTEEQREKARQMHQARFAKRLTRMQKHLNLSDEQVAQIQAIREQGGSREEVHAVLTEEQRTQLEEMRARHPHRGGNRD